MSDANAPDAAPAAPAKPPGRGASKLIPALLVVNLGATGFIVWKSMSTAPAAAAVASAPSERGSGSAATPTGAVKGPVASIEPFVANLDEPGTPRYIKLTIELEMANDDALKALEDAKQPVRDQVLGFLSGLKVVDTLGEASRQKIREGLLARVTAVVGKNQVRRMFFSEFVVQ